MARLGFRRIPVPAAAQQQGQPFTFPAPTAGWVANVNEAVSMPLAAKRLENWFPTQRGIRARGGSQLFATITTTCLSMFTHITTAGQKRLFAANASSVFNITSVADPLVPPAAEFSGQTSGYYSFAPFATAGGNFTYICNGTEAPRLYDGTTWTAITGVSTPAITGVTTTALSHVWVYRNRLFFIQSGSMNAWALPVDSLGGAAIQISLAGVFQKGGALLTGGTWSLDAGDGLDDRCVIISNQGEVAVFDGSNPADPADWHLTGRYDVTPLMGKRGMVQVGGDLLLLTEDGIVPMSAVVSKDSAALSLAAVTVPIEPEWRAEVLARNSNPWEMIKFPRLNMGIVSWPKTATTDPYCAVVNLETGAWAKYTGWDTQCLIMHDEWGFFGTSTGQILRMEAGGKDNGALYYCTYVGLFTDMGSPMTKTIRLARATFLAGFPFNPKISVSTDYTINLPSPPSSPADVASGLWDTGLWDVALWDSSRPTQTVTNKVVSIGRTGFAFAPQVQLTFGVSFTPDTELVVLTAFGESGGIFT